MFFDNMPQVCAPDTFVSSSTAHQVDRHKCANLCTTRRVELTCLALGKTSGWNPAPRNSRTSWHLSCRASCRLLPSGDNRIPRVRIILQPFSWTHRMDGLLWRAPAAGIMCVVADAESLFPLFGFLGFTSLAFFHYADDLLLLFFAVDSSRLAEANARCEGRDAGTA
jgi:hypothetical protein